VEHLKSIHGPPRFTCGVCQVFTSSNLQRVQKHLKLDHKVSQTILRAVIPYKKNPDVDDFTVLPKVPLLSKTTAKTGSIKTYSPGQEEELPKIPIYLVSAITFCTLFLSSLMTFFQENVYCSICNFKTRVRSNMIRHLKDHAERGEEASTAAIPINPTPCLKTGEKHFDKMLNWAKSSHVTPEGAPAVPPRRASQDLPAEEVDKFPAYVAEASR